MNSSIHLEDDGMCYACGRKNKKGLQLEFRFFEQERRIETTFVPTDEYQGWKGIVHGGIIATLLDEVMAKLVHRLGYHALTASLEVKFKAMATTQNALTVSAEVNKITKKLIFTRAKAQTADGTLVAQAQGKLMIY